MKNLLSCIAAIFLAVLLILAAMIMHGFLYALQLFVLLPIQIGFIATSAVMQVFAVVWEAVTDVPMAFVSVVSRISDEWSREFGQPQTA